MNASLDSLPVSNPGATRMHSTFVESLTEQEENDAFNVDVDESEDDDVSEQDAPVQDDEYAMPECLSLPLTSEGENAVAKLELYSSFCLKCSALVGDEPLPAFGAKPGESGKPLTAEKRKCHASKGNPSCPAGQIVFVFAGPRRKALKSLLATRARHGASSRVYLAELGQLAQTNLSDQDIEWVTAQLAAQ